MPIGHIKLHRSIQDNQIWLSEKFTDSQAWIDLLLLANYHPGTIKKRGIRIELKRGEIGWSEIELSKRWRWSRGKVRRFLNWLFDEKMIQRVVQENSKITTHLKITNYNQYQDSGTINNTTDGQETDKRRTRDGTGSNKNKKNKKNKTNADVPKTGHQGVIKFFYESCVKEKGFKPNIDAADGQAVKKCLLKMNEKEIQEAIVFYLTSQKAEDKGITLKACLSTHSLNMFKQNWEKKKGLYA